MHFEVIITCGLPQILGSLLLVYTVPIVHVLKPKLDKILEIKVDINIRANNMKANVTKEGHFT